MRQAKRRRGFTLVEIIIDAFIITVVFTALASGFIAALQSVKGGQVRLAAATLTNQQMEKLRNLPYDSLSTEHGTILPQGTIPDSQTVTQGGVSFTLATTIITVDDPFDGCAIPAGGLYRCTDGQTSPTQDPVPVDYKRITVTATQTGHTNVLSRLSSNTAAKAAETPSNTGILLIIVNDAQGNPVEAATVTVTNNSTGTDVTGTTNAQGYVFIANVTPDSQNGYHIVATKAGYSSDFTTPRTAQNPNQFQPDVDVQAQQITTQTLVIDHLATMNVSVVDQNGAPVGNVAVTATSEKYTQTNPVIPKNVYNQTTDGSGLAAFSAIEWDSYTLTVPSGDYVISTSPYQDVAVAPGATTTVTLAVSTDATWPVITTVTPTSGPSGQVVTIVVNGSNFSSGSTLVLQLSGQTDLVPTSLTVNANGKSLSATFNLQNVVAGNWDIVVNAGGKVVKELEGFTVS